MHELKIVRERRSGYGLLRRFRSSADVYEAFREHFGLLDREEFVVLLLDAKNAFIGFNVVSVGSLTSSLVHPREVLCAVRCYMASLPQGGRTCRNVLGSTTDLERKLKGNKSMSIKQEITEDAIEHRPARSAWYGESYTARSSVSEGLIARPIGTASETDTDSIAVLKTYPDNLQSRQRWTMRPLKRRTSHLPHASTCHVADHGIAYRARAPRQRSSHSSPQWGEPTPWRRGTGRSDD